MQRRNFFKAALGLFSAIPALTVASQVAASPASDTTGITAGPSRAVWPIKTAPQDLYEEAVQHLSESEFLRALHWIDIPGGSYTYLQEGFLPGVGFKGQSVAGSTGIINPQTEVLKIAGGDCDVDKALIKTHGASIVPTRRRAYLRAQAYNLTDMFINGSTDHDPRQCDGLRTRVVGSMLVNVNGRLTRTTLDNAIARTQDADHLLVPVEMRDAMKARRLLKKTGETYRYTTRDKKTTVTVITDYRLDGVPPIMGWNEPGGGASTYVLNLSKKGIVGLQNNNMEVDDLGEVYDKPVIRARYEWLVTMAVFQGRAATRLTNISKPGVLNA